MIEFPIVDSHVHLCDPGGPSYSWTRNVPELKRLVPPEHLSKAAEPVRSDQFVFVEADADEGQHLDEAAWVAEQAQRDPRLKGMVAALPLERGAAIEGDLDPTRRAQDPARRPPPDQKQPDPDFCIWPDFIDGLKLLGSRGLAFDICVFHHHLPNVIKMVKQCPEVRFVLDYITRGASQDERRKLFRDNAIRFYRLDS